MRSLFIGSLVVVAACANDPIYVSCDQLETPDPLCIPLEAGMDDGAGGIIAEAKAQLKLPVNIETTDDATIRAARTAELGVDVPYVKLGDIEVSVEWTITNLDAAEGIALIELNGANEFFEFDPDLIVLGDPDEVPPTPPLEGNIPLHIAGNATITGVFREDQLREASIDLDQITRANVNPFAATLTINKNTDSIQPFLPYDPTMPDEPPAIDPNAVAIPREAFAQMIRIDLVFTPDRHMRLDFAVRVRDVRGIMNDKLLGADVAELQTFTPMMFAVMAPP